MRAFANLYTRLDQTTKTSEKLAALRDYFAAAEPADAAWAVYFLSGHKPPQVVPTRRLAIWAAESADIPLWLFEESVHAVGDLAETIALLLPEPQASSSLPLHQWVEGHLLPLRAADEATQRAELLNAWRQMDRQQRFVWNKLITGEFRVGVAAQMVTRALAEVSGHPPAVIAHRLMGNWKPSAAFYERLVGPETDDAEISRPYPFCLAHPLEQEPAELGPREDWQAEWKWDGIRAQIVRREGEVFLWTRGEELVTDRYPEIRDNAMSLPDGCVLDGEIVAWKEGAVLPFGELQRRIGRKSLSKKLLADVPVAFLAFDVLEHDGSDIRAQTLRQRREDLERLLEPFPATTRLLLSPTVAASTWEELAAVREQSRERNVEGLMLKRLDSPYAVGRPRGVWWKWKVNPFTVDAVLIYAQRGHGRRASLYTDYTFAVWDNGVLVPFAKAYSGLTDAEIREVDQFVRRHTLERFGPVRSVAPELVFELGFEGLRRSTRHKSGIAVRFPRMLRWRKDKRSDEADTLERIRALLPPGERERD